MRPRRTGRPDVLPDGRPDPCPDVCTVTREVDGFVCKHFPNSGTEESCCVVRVTRRAGEADVETLARADREIDARHQLQPSSDFVLTAGAGAR
jgi:hypothetical protein